MADQIKISGTPEKDSIGEGDFVVGNVGATTDATGRVTIPALRTRLNIGDQDIVGDVSITGDEEISGSHKAASYEGNGVLITGVPSSGVGGNSSEDSLSLICNSANGTPDAKVVISKYSTDLVDIDETGVSPKTGIPYTHDDDAIPFDKDLDLQGKRIIRDQGRLESQVFQALHFNGDGDFVEWVDDQNLDFGTQDFGIDFYGKLENNASNGYILAKRTTGAGWYVRKNANGTLRLGYDDGSGLIALDTSTTVIDTDKNIAISINGDRSGNAIVWINGVKDSATLDISSDTNSLSNSLALRSGKSSTGVDFLSGLSGHIRLWNRTRTDDEAKAFSANPQKALDFADEGASNTDLTSGTLTIGKRYRINTYVATDDFTNVGAASNATGVEFIATGTTPTDWTNSSVLNQIGATLNLKPSGIGDEFWVDDSGNGNDGAITGATPSNPLTFSDIDCRYKLKVPRLTTSQKTALTAVNGMIVYDTTLNKFQGFENGSFTSFI